ncbi:hypothetical protein ACPOL_3025 [Acidisarcina polymorpha]|uniref:Uncharacterized protein n=1 Tax=Acidisarcina polymorpha TaxID=2211140 RepID=A0A2Z5G0U1_9BACT|nr:hypothetical protein ACPOL_3025 [Acidisarcina polymorpha]
MVFIARLDSPIGEMPIVIDHVGQLRAADWADHEKRMN